MIAIPFIKPLLFLVVAFSVVTGCIAKLFGPTPERAAEQKAAREAERRTRAELVPGARYELGGLAYTFHRVDRIHVDDASIEPLVAIDYTVENTTDAPQPLPTVSATLAAHGDYLFLTSLQGKHEVLRARSRDSSTETTDADRHHHIDDYQRKLAPGSVTKDVVVFEVKPDVLGHPMTLIIPDRVRGGSTLTAAWLDDVRPEPKTLELTFTAGAHE